MAVAHALKGFLENMYHEIMDGIEAPDVEPQILDQLIPAINKERYGNDTDVVYEPGNPNDGAVALIQGDKVLVYYLGGYKSDALLRRRLCESAYYLGTKLPADNVKFEFLNSMELWNVPVSLEFLRDLYFSKIAEE